MFVLKGLTDEYRLIQTMIHQSEMNHGEAQFIVWHNLEKCVEVWEDNELCLYLMILRRYGVRSFHGYKLCKGKVRRLLKVAENFLKENGHIYSGYKEKNRHVGHVLKFLGFHDVASSGTVKVMERI